MGGIIVRNTKYEKGAKVRNTKVTKRVWKYEIRNTKYEKGAKLRNTKYEKGAKVRNTKVTKVTKRVWNLTAGKQVRKYETGIPDGAIGVWKCEIQQNKIWKSSIFRGVAIKIGSEKLKRLNAVPEKSLKKTDVFFTRIGDRFCTGIKDTGVLKRKKWICTYTLIKNLNVDKR